MVTRFAGVRHYSLSITNKSQWRGGIILPLKYSSNRVSGVCVGKQPTDWAVRVSKSKSFGSAAQKKNANCD